MRRILFLSIAGLLALAAIAYAVYYFTTGRYIQTTDNAYVEADIAVIAPKIDGYVATVAVTDNQPVKAGDALFTLDDRDYRAALAKTTAEVARLRDAINTASSTASAGGSQIGEAQASLLAARAEAARARADVARFGTLLKQGWVSKANYDVKVADAESRDAAVAQAQAAIAAARSSASASRSGTGGARASLAGAQASVAAAQLDLGNTVIRAPVDGVVGNRTVRTGQYLRIGQQALVVVPLARVYVVANFKETQIGRMHAGQRVELKADAYKGQTVTGHIVSLSPAAGSRFSVLPPENATGNFTKIVQRVPVKVQLDPLPKGVRLVPGMSVEASVDVRG